ncbi:hypothetical protein BKA62DRAFT_768640 [Auriculariales sp. MPI-PUGE-AT-0066]|nr:hypothetical protein BKA62DRAFT_768640 [Auriculariales sp. MPI-PUGE-AT-0066]
MTFPTTFHNGGAVVRPLVRDVPLSQASVMLTIALDVGGLLDKPTLIRFRASLTAQIADYFERTENKSWSFTLELDTTPPKPLLAAAFSIRIRWSNWFDSISPAGAPVHVTIRDDRFARPASVSVAPSTTTTTTGIARSPSPVLSLGRSSSCSSMRSAASGSTAPTSIHSIECSPIIPLSELANLNLGNGASFPALEQQQRRVRRQRGGVKQKQRGIHVDKAKLEVTPYDNGITGVLTGGVMLGRRPRPAQSGVVVAPQPA